MIFVCLCVQKWVIPQNGNVDDEHHDQSMDWRVYRVYIYIYYIDPIVGQIHLIEKSTSFDWGNQWVNIPCLPWTEAARFSG